MDTQNAIFQKFKNVATVENQILIMQQLANMETMIDSIGNNISQTVTSSGLNLRKTTKRDTEIMKPIRTLIELEEFERKVHTYINSADKNVMNDFVLKFSYICGRKGSGKGLKYVLFTSGENFLKKVYDTLLLGWWS